MASTTHPVHPDVLTLADLLLAEWSAVRERIRASGHPTCEGDEGDTDDADKSDDDTKDTKDTKDDSDADDKADDADKGAEDDWKARSRQNERRAKAEKKRADDLAAKLAKREQEDMTEQDRKIAEARDAATSEVTTKYEAERRDDRIENAVTKLSLGGFKVKGEDGKETTLRFADPDDAQLRLDRALRNGDLNYDDIYEDGKVQRDAVTDFLAEVLRKHPRLRSEGKNGATTTTEAGDLEAGKGGATKVTAGGVEDDFNKIRRHKP